MMRGEKVSQERRDENKKGKRDGEKTRTRTMVMTAASRKKGS